MAQAYQQSLLQGDCFLLGLWVLNEERAITFIFRAQDQEASWFVFSQFLKILISILRFIWICTVQICWIPKLHKLILLVKILPSPTKARFDENITKTFGQHHIGVGNWEWEFCVGPSITLVNFPSPVVAPPIAPSSQATARGKCSHTGLLPGWAPDILERAMYK